MDPGLIADVLQQNTTAPDDIRELRRRVAEALEVRIVTEGEEDGD